MQSTRRQFLRTATAAVAAPLVVSSSVLGKDGFVAPSNRITMGFVGIGHQGGGHLFGGAWTYLTGGYLARKEVQVLAVCDIVKGKREGGAARINDYYSKQAASGEQKSCQPYLDFRELLARPDIEAVLIGTPVHLHAYQAILAAKAGKDVYCEKPTALVIQDSRAIVEAFKRYGRVYQAGSQQRSEYGGKFRMAAELVKAGRIGKLKTVYSYIGGGWLTWGSQGFGKGGGKPGIGDAEWDLFLGPAPWRPNDGNIDAHRFGNGDSNWGQHHWDVVQWGIPGADETGPVEVGPIDGQLGARYANGVTIVAGRYPDPTMGLGPKVRFAGEGGCVYVGTDGLIAVDRQQILSNPVDILKKPLTPDDPRVYFSQSHSGNFLECVRSRRKTITDVESTHRAASLMCLVGISQRLGGRLLKWDPDKEQFINDAEADTLLSVGHREPYRIY